MGKHTKAETDEAEEHAEFLAGMLRGLMNPGTDIYSLSPEEAADTLKLMRHAAEYVATYFGNEGTRVLTLGDDGSLVEVRAESTVRK